MHIFTAESSKKARIYSKKQKFGQTIIPNEQKSIPTHEKSCQMGLIMHVNTTHSATSLKHNLEIHRINMILKIESILARISADELKIATE